MVPISLMVTAEMVKLF
jgi:phospholipid-transporting ATPase